MRLAVASEIILLTKQQERLTPPEAMGDAARNVLSGLAQDVFYYVAQAPGIFLPPLMSMLLSSINSLIFQLQKGGPAYSLPYKARFQMN
jgi:hypothetical protein